MDYNTLQTDVSKIESNPLTGAKRESKKGKGRFDLIPYHALFRLARHYENGAVLHGDRNWEAGLPLKVYYNAAMRHLIGWLNGDNSEDHLAALAWNTFGLMHHEEAIRSGKLPLELCDVPSRLPFLTPEGKSDQGQSARFLVELAMDRIRDAMEVPEKSNTKVSQEVLTNLGFPRDDSDADWKDELVEKIRTA